jgi:hypothetical protein
VSIKPEEALTQKFRFVVFDGDPDVRRLEELWQGYAHPARAVGK